MDVSLRHMPTERPLSIIKGSACIMYVLQCVAVCCSVLQCVAVCLKGSDCIM